MIVPHMTYSTKEAFPDLKQAYIAVYSLIGNTDPSSVALATSLFPSTSVSLATSPFPSSSVALATPHFPPSSVALPFPVLLRRPALSRPRLLVKSYMEVSSETSDKTEALCSHHSEWLILPVRNEAPSTTVPLRFRLATHRAQISLTIAANRTLRRTAGGLKLIVTAPSLYRATCRDLPVNLRVLFVAGHPTSV
eukprot:Em0024g483a